ncbi:universal stress protein [Natronorubrum sp. JWXQ-INN-674]|uniref:Universal stress protein n=1 Tax=Natronorubrum halalkaliphilum TaxID=2691917 RepID=A0A6B0VR94_9EURY|nr:universal stress protein [Natronorubrum halalkaliphilum]MXV63302.1 universal stress protein [Natronorubrum halalkaliphilum]
MYELLVPVDLDERRALSQAQWVASLPNAEESVAATILFVFESDTLEEIPEAVKQQTPSKQFVDSVRTAFRYLDDRGIDVDVVDRRFEPAETIWREAHGRGVQTIVLGGRKQSPVGEHAFGSVTQQLMLKSDIPVVVTGSPDSR